jgi:hypothetical protein
MVGHSDKGRMRRGWAITPVKFVHVNCRSQALSAGKSRRGERRMSRWVGFQSGRLTGLIEARFRPRRRTKGKFCIIAGSPVNKGLGTLQMSIAKWRG